MIKKFYWILKKTSQAFKTHSKPYIRRFIRLIALPYYYCVGVNWKECNKSKYQVVKDLCYIFFKLKYYPDNYSACRLFEKERSQWHKYYGSNYNPYQKARLSRFLQPVEYEIIFEDKEVCWQMCKGMDFPVPDTYGSVDTYENYHQIIRDTMKDNSLNEMIVKPVRGSAGQGVVKLQNENGKIVVRDKFKIFSLDTFKLTEKSLLQKVVLQDPEISNIARFSINTIRVITMITSSGEIIILGSTMRFGIGDAHIDNWSAGGIAVGVDVKKGQLKAVAFDKRGAEFRQHPESNIIFEGYSIPCWSGVVALSKKVQDHFKYFKLLGMDIALSENGPVIIEINACPDFVFQEQTSGPLLEDGKTAKAFKEYGLLINKYQKRIAVAL